MELDRKIDFNDGLFWGLILGVGGNALVSLVTGYVPEPIRLILLLFLAFVAVCGALFFMEKNEELNRQKIGKENEDNVQDLETYPNKFPLYRYKPTKGLIRFFIPLEIELVWIDRRTKEETTPPYQKYLDAIQKYNLKSH